MTASGQDLRQAFRFFLKAPAVTAIGLFSLALGMGANTSMFALMSALMLRPLPVADPKHLVTVGSLDRDHAATEAPVSLAMFDEIRRRTDMFSGVLAWSGTGMSNFQVNGAMYAGSVDTVSGDYFAVLGIRPVLGRLLTHDDAPLDGRPPAQVAVIHYGCWRARFNGNPNVVGKVIRVDGIPLTIVGIAPEGFTGVAIDASPEATVPIGFSGRPLKYRENLWFNAIGRLQPGIDIRQARARIEALWPSILRATLPDSFHGMQRERFLARRADVQPVAQGYSFMRRKIGKPIAVLMALVGAVLLIACMNLANLLLARGAARQHEFAIRVALGARRWQLMRLVLLEALLLSFAGAVLGLFMARFTARYLLASFWTGYVPLGVDPVPDARVLAFAVLLALLTGLLFGIVPALRMSGCTPATALSANARATGGRSQRLNRVFLAGQLALSLVLVLGALLFLRTLQNLSRVDLGYRRDHLLLLQLFPQPGHEKLPDRTQYYRELTRRESQVPGVEGATFSHMGPWMFYEFKEPVSVGPGLPSASAVEEWAGPGFFGFMGVHLLAGRDFEWSDNEQGPRAVVISESLARKLFGNQNAIGQRIDVGSDPKHKGLIVVGVVNSAALWKPDSHQPLAVYFALMQEPTYNQPMLDLRTRVEPLRVARAAERELESLGHHYSLRTQTLEQRMSNMLVERRMMALLASSFGALALVLAAVGLYGVFSYTVARRTAEIGVRMALGAGSTAVLRLVLGEVLRLVGFGIAIAIIVAFALRRIGSGMFFGVTVMDPAMIAIAATVLGATALAAGLVPARRAAKMDPITALRCE